MHSTLPFHERCIGFSAGILRLAVDLRKNQDLRTFSDQILRSGTSVGANAGEARSAESRADFIHKMQIALKELRETAYWLALIQKSGLIEYPAVSDLRKECSELTAILVVSVRTAKQNSISKP
jgi:four helix bundle protein